jgi:pyridoxal phosphate enzyme (YggS family)
MDSTQADPDPNSQPAPLAGLEAVNRSIVAACERAGRDPRSVTLIAVSKTVSAQTLKTTIAGGQWVYGENRVQETMHKWPALRAEFTNLELHLIGPLQSNKVRSAVAFFDVIQSVDRLSLAEALARESEKQARRPLLFIQVNTGLEPQKAGIALADTDTFVATCRNRYGLLVSGLMCIPPVDQPPQSHFTLLAELAARNGLSCLSMGMSADFALAIEHGATHVRVGTAIFGALLQPADTQGVA